MGSSTIYDIKSQTKKLRDYMKATDIPKAAENRHTLQYHCGEMMDKHSYIFISIVCYTCWLILNKANKCMLDFCNPSTYL